MDDWAAEIAAKVQASLEGGPYIADDVERIAAVLRAERERNAKLVERLREEWFHDGIPGDLAVPAGAFARSMKQLAAVIRAGEG